jgi:hypothetical protein
MDKKTSILQGKQYSSRRTITTKKKDEDLLSETEEGLILSHAMCAVEKDEAIVMPETKRELVMNIMTFDEMESEEFPMSSEIIAHEQKKNSQLK